MCYCFRGKGQWHQVENTIIASNIWKEADAAIKTLVDTLGIKPLGFPSDMTYSFLIPLFYSYFCETGHIAYNKRLAKKVIDRLISHLNAPGYNFVGLVILENIRAFKPFKLDLSKEKKAILQLGEFKRLKFDIFNEIK